MQKLYVCTCVCVYTHHPPMNILRAGERCEPAVESLPSMCRAAAAPREEDIVAYKSSNYQRKEEPEVVTLIRKHTSWEAETKGLLCFEVSLGYTVSSNLH